MHQMSEDSQWVWKSTRLTVHSPLSRSIPPSSPAPTSRNLLSPTSDLLGSPERAISPNSEAEPESSVKDLAFLLDQSIYHPVSQLEIPAPFRIPFPTLVKEDELQTSLSQLEKLLSAGHFLQVAYFAALILSSGKVKSTDVETIFQLLQIRFSCLELTGNTNLAAQEAKALEDLNSAFYFTAGENGSDEHIMPYPLRLQALRLQSLGFSDPRRGISTLYDLGLECREKIALPSTSEEDRELWRRRLRDVGIRVVNALIEMEDMEAARRTLMSQLPRRDMSGDELTSELLFKTVLLLIRIGDIASATDLLQKNSSKDNGMLQALLCVSEGRWEDAVESWQKVLDGSNASIDQTVVKQNLAVALLYVGRLPEVSLPSRHHPNQSLKYLQARKMMEELVQGGQGFQSLTFNLATLYELSMANPFGSKRQLAERVSQQSGGLDRNWGRSNADFKL